MSRKYNVVKLILDKSIFDENVIHIILKLYWDLLPKAKILLDWIPLDKLDWNELSGNKNAIDLWEDNIDKIDWSRLSNNHNAIELLTQNHDKIDWSYLSLNKKLDEKIIPIDNVRKLNIFFHKTFSVSKIKIAVINSIDNLSINSLNSLLKIIEEPPENSLIFLISHKPMNILKTITSRCSVFNLKPLDKETFDIFLLNHIKSSSEDELLFIKDISNRSPGLALKINDKEIFKSYLNLLDDLMCSNKYLNIRNSLMKLYFIKNNDEVFLLFVLRLMIVNLIKKVVFYQFENNFLKSTLTKEQDFINFIVKKNSKLNLLKLYSKFDKDMNSALLLNVNKSDVTMNFLKDLCLT